MADNVAITAGSGTTVSTEEVTTLNGGAVSAQHLQRVAAAIRTADGTAVDLPGDATNGLDVDVVRINGVAPAFGSGVRGSTVQRVTVATDDVVPVSDNGGSLTVDGTVTANLAAGTNNIGDVDVLSVPAPLSTTGGGTEATALRVTVATDSTGVLSVDDNGGSLTVDGTVTANLAAGTNNIGDVDVLSIAAGTNYIGKVRLTDGTNDQSVATNGGAAIAGCTAHDSADAGSPVKVGAKAIAHSTNPTAVAAADRSDLYCNRAGVLFVIGGHPNTQTVSVRLTGASTDAAIVAGTISTGTKVVVTRLSVTVSNATTVNVGCKIGFAAATLAADSTTGAAGILIDSDGFPPGGGINLGDGSGIIGIGADGEEIRITNDAPTSGSLHITCSYYTIES